MSARRPETQLRRLAEFIEIVGRGPEHRLLGRPSDEAAREAQK